jgi:pyridoxamine 5'-phosphate oxidase
VSDWSGVPEPSDHRISAAELAALRRQYGGAPLIEGGMAPDPFDQFLRWFADVRLVPDVVVEPNAMVLSTADAEGRPSARTVLLKAVDDRGFVLFTNYGSRKAQEAAANPFASLVFPWFAVSRQVIVVGGIERIPADESAAYFRVRPRASQLGAWASHQSAPIDGRRPLEQRYAELEERWRNQEIPVPDFWGGLRVVPSTVEFWHGRPDRLHDRLRYRRVDDGWALERLSP